MSSDICRRAFTEAHDLRHGYGTDLHFLSALLRAPAPTPSAEVIVELGLSYEKVRDRIVKWNRPRRKRAGTLSTPTYQLILGWAQGIAIGMGYHASTTSMSCWHLPTATGGASRLIGFGIAP